MLNRFFVTLCLGLILAACEPIGPLPGTGLSGQVVATPASWEPTNIVEVIQLETSGPRSVNIWGVGLDTGYYVASSAGEKSTWASRITRDPEVRLRIEDNIYELRAEVVTDAEELARVGAAFQQKYELDAGEDFPEATLYRLDPR